MPDFDYLDDGFIFSSCQLVNFASDAPQHTQVYDLIDYLEYNVF